MKRNITLASIALILLVAIAITIILGVSKGIPGLAGALQSRPSMSLEKVDLQQATLNLPLLNEPLAKLSYTVKSNLKSDSKLNLKAASKVELKSTSKTELKAGLGNELRGGLKESLKQELTAQLNSLTDSANKLEARLGLDSRTLDVALNSALGDNLNGLLLT